MKLSSEPPTPALFFVGKSRRRDWKFASGIEHFDREWKFRARLNFFDRWALWVFKGSELDFSLTFPGALRGWAMAYTQDMCAI